MTEEYKNQFKGTAGMGLSNRDTGAGALGCGNGGSAARGKVTAGRETGTETGRSMVEMLGVLAIIGVLSVGGIAGYKYAMDKHRVNELLDEASKRAVLYSMNPENTDLSDFPSEARLSGGTMYSGIVTDDEGLALGQFGIEVSGVSKDVCEKLEETISDDTPLRRLDPSGCGSDTNDFLMVYTNEMSTEAFAEDYGNQADCAEAGYHWCSSGPHANSCQANCCAGVDTACSTCNSETGATANKTDYLSVCANKIGKNGYCVSGSCKTDGCFSNNDCDSGQFCKYGSYLTTYSTRNVVTVSGATASGQGGYKGVCTALGNSVPTTGKTASGYVKSSSTMNWWSAKNWCAAKEMTLADISGNKLGCYNGSTAFSYPSSTGYCCAEGGSGSGCEQSTAMQNLRSASEFGTSGYLWTDTDYSASIAYIVYLSNGIVGYNSRNNGRYALCK